MRTRLMRRLVPGVLVCIMAGVAARGQAPTTNIIPLPRQLLTRPGIFTLCQTQQVQAAWGRARTPIAVDSPSLETGQYLAGMLACSTGYRFTVVTNSAAGPVRGAILLTTVNALPSLGAEGYELTVAPDSVVIRAPAQAGLFYGVQSLLQLLPPQILSPRPVTGVGWIAPCVYIQDQPRFSWRGVMLDVARHFFTVDEVKQLLDAMALHKLNTLHLHLADDQGWRLQINGYPLLTPTAQPGVAAGAWRNGIDYNLNPRASTAFDPATGQYGGYYTQADARNFVAYAAQRHITVVPEIEMPAHSMACLAAYPQFSCGHSSSDYLIDFPAPNACEGSLNYCADVYSVGSPATMTFLTNVLSQVMSIFPSHYIHCGGDELLMLGPSTTNSSCPSGWKLTSPEDDNDWNTYPADTSNMMNNNIVPGTYLNNGVLPEYISCASFNSNQPLYPCANPSYGDISIAQYQHWFSTTIASFLQANGRMMMGWTEFEYGGVVPNAALMDWEPAGGGAFAAQAAQAGMPVVMAPSSPCYWDHLESSTLSVEPPYGGTGTRSLSAVYSLNPIPCGLSGPAANNILGAEGALWAEYIPSFRNVMFKVFPRAAALAEVTWTPASQQTYSGFLTRLQTQEQRYSQMGVNYDRESIPQIGSWAHVPSSPTPVPFDITSLVTAAGEIDVNFWWTGGSNLSISSVALLVNGTQVDIDSHAGTATPSSGYPAEPHVPIYTLYVLHLNNYIPGATYTIQAVLSDSVGTSAGAVYLPNWN